MAVEASRLGGMELARSRRGLLTFVVGRGLGPLVVLGIGQMDPIFSSLRNPLLVATHIPDIHLTLFSIEGQIDNT